MGTKTEIEAEKQPSEEAAKPTEDTVDEAVAKEVDASEQTESDASQLQSRLDEAYGKNAELQNNYLRKAADLDNMR